MPVYKHFVWILFSRIYGPVQNVQNIYGTYNYSICTIALLSLYNPDQILNDNCYRAVVISCHFIFSDSLWLSKTHFIP